MPVVRQEQVPGHVMGVTQESTQRGNPKYNIQFSDGQSYSCFDLNKANRAQQFVNQPGTLLVDVTDKGYRNFGDFVPQGQSLPAQPQGLGGPVGQPVAQPLGGVPLGGAPLGAPAPIPMAAPSGGGGFSAEDKLRVTRLSGLSSGAVIFAAALEAGLVEATSLEDALSKAWGFTHRYAEASVKYGYEGTGPGGQVATPAATQAAPAPAQPVVAQDPAAIAAYLAAQGLTVSVGAPVAAPAAPAPVDPATQLPASAPLPI